MKCIKAGVNGFVDGKIISSRETIDGVTLLA